MKTSPKGILLVHEFEGFEERAYLDPVGIPTIGYGFTKGVRLGDKMTRQEGDERLRAELVEYERGVTKAVASATQDQFDALVCFAFNVGVGGMAGSTVIRLHNRGDFAGAAKAFEMWNKAGGRVLNGLVRRRKAEAEVYLTGKTEEVESWDSKLSSLAQSLSSSPSSAPGSGQSASADQKPPQTSQSGTLAGWLSRLAKLLTRK